MTSAPEMPTAPSARAPHRNRRRLAGALAGSLVLGSVAAGLAGIAPAQAGETMTRYEQVRTAQVRLCDPTGCLYAWGVVDSDGDGVSDADELVAGSDPHDASSTPTLQHLADLSYDRGLPSFEAGLSAFVVLPAELVAMTEQATKDLLADYSFEAFPLPARGEALSRLGIDTEQMKELGVDPARSGFTIGLDANRKDDRGLPARRIGGVDMRLISADGDKDHDPAADPKPPTTAPPATPAPGATTPDTRPPATPPPTSSGGDKDHQPVPGGGGEDDPEPLPKPGPNWVDWAGTVDGNAVYKFHDGTTIILGKEGWMSEQKKGGDIYFWPATKYENPDADDATVATPEQKDAFERTVGAATRTVEGWRSPRADGDAATPEHKRTLVAYIESDLALSLVAFDDPKVTSAQPEMRPDLPNPMAGAPEGGTKGGSGGGCTDSVCGG